MELRNGGLTARKLDLEGLAGFHAHRNLVLENLALRHQLLLLRLQATLDQYASARPKHLAEHVAKKAKAN
jgi:hypothetical protein